VKLDASILKQLIKEELSKLSLLEQTEAGCPKGQHVETRSHRGVESQKCVCSDGPRQGKDGPAGKGHWSCPGQEAKKDKKPATTKKAAPVKKAAKATEQPAKTEKTDKPTATLKGEEGKCEQRYKNSTKKYMQNHFQPCLDYVKKKKGNTQSEYTKQARAKYKKRKEKRGGQGGPRTASAGGAGGQYRRAQQPLTPQEHATAVRLYNAVKTLIAEKHPQLQNIWQAIVRAARGGHKIAAAVVTALGEERRGRERQVTQATQTGAGDSMRG